MYEAHFELKQKPFGLLPDPDFLYLSKRHTEALAMLEYGLFDRTGIVLITGEIGCGKTTLVRELLSNKEDEVVVGIINNTHRDFGELLKWVALSFGLEYRNKEKVELYETLVIFLRELESQGKKATLIIDEAQNMDVSALEELRMLSNINVDKEQVLQLILVGQPELRSTMLQPELRQFVQRIAIDYYLEPLEPKEVFEYIQHRMDVAGGGEDVFDVDAAIAVYRYSRGVPRLINILCDTALVYAYAQSLKHINADLIDEVAHDKKDGSILPLHGFSEPDTDISAGKAVEHVTLDSRG